MKRPNVVLLMTGASLVLTGGCSAVVQPDATATAIPASFTKVLSAGPATYVLSQVEQQTGDEIVLFDHACPSGRVVVSHRDTIVLSGDGTIRRAGVLERTIGDGELVSSAVIATGRWSPVSRPSLRRPTIAVTTSTENGRSVGTYEIQVVGDAALHMESGLGGSCPGSPNDGRPARFVYTRR